MCYTVLRLAEKGDFSMAKKKKTILDLSPKELSERAARASRKAVDKLVSQGIYAVKVDGSVSLQKRTKSKHSKDLELAS